MKAKLTLGENIADLGGLNVAYDALQMALKNNPQESKAKIGGYTQDQRFFLNRAHLAPEHPAGKRQGALP